MDHIWAPWRIEYIERPKNDGCIFCEKLRAGADRENLILHRGRHVFLVLNLYPYNPGHVMVTPYLHTSRMGDLSTEAVVEMWELADRTMEAIREAMRPEGFNLGLNLGAVAGAGVRDHLHLHVVPRWQGDTNFMPVLAETNVMPEHLSRTWEKLDAALRRVLAR
jgi:ATP adenylyltransferase